LQQSKVIKLSIVKSLHFAVFTSPEKNVNVTSRTRHPLNCLRANPTAGAERQQSSFRPQPVAGAWRPWLAKFVKNSILSWNYVLVSFLVFKLI